MNGLSPAAADLLRGVVRLMADLGIAAIAEFPLPSGRRVDIVGLGRDGTIHVVEIKSSRQDFRTDHKWHEYLDHADRFYFAVSADFPMHILPEDEGLIVADRYGAELLRPPRHRALPSARRKALTLRLARVAATRLMLPALAEGQALPDQP